MTKTIVIIKREIEIERIKSHPYNIVYEKLLMKMDENCVFKVTKLRKSGNERYRITEEFETDYIGFAEIMAGRKLYRHNIILDSWF